MLDINQCEIKIKLNEKGNMLAQAEIYFNVIHIYGFRIMQTNDKETLFISPPSIRSGRGNYIDIIRIEDKQKWKELETKIKQEYKKVKEDFDKVTLDLKDQVIDPDELPF